MTPTKRKTFIDHTQNMQNNLINARERDTHPCSNLKFLTDTYGSVKIEKKVAATGRPASVNWCIKYLYCSRIDSILKSPYYTGEPGRKASLVD